MLGFFFVIAKVVVIYLKLGFLMVLVYKLAKVQTYSLVFQFCLCKSLALDVLVRQSHLCKL
jgi:hypothetical protein